MFNFKMRTVWGQTHPEVTVPLCDLQPWFWNVTILKSENTESKEINERKEFQAVLKMETITKCCSKKTIRKYAANYFQFQPKFHYIWLILWLFSVPTLFWERCYQIGRCNFYKAIQTLFQKLEFPTNCTLLLHAHEIFY